MKKLIIVLIILYSTVEAYSQIAFYAANKIDKDLIIKLDTSFKFKGDSVTSLAAVLKAFLPKKDSILKDGQVLAKFRNNPFFGNEINQFLNTLGASTEKTGLIKNVASSLGGLDVTKYANAISDIMIERAKQELTVAFFNQFRNFAEDNPEFKILFPKTTINLSNLLSYKYVQMLPALRSGFFEDLKQLTYNLDDMMNLPRYQTLLRNYPEVRMAFKSLRLVHEIETGASNAADIIKEFSMFDEWDDKTDNKIRSVGSCIKIASLFSESIRNDSSQSHSDDVWVSSEKLKDLFYDNILFKLYMGLMYQKAKSDSLLYIASDGSQTEVKKILEDQKVNMFLFKNKLKEFIDLTGNVNTAFLNFKKTTDDNNNLSHEEIFNYVNTTIEVIDYSFSIVKIFNEKPIADDYLALLKISNNLYRSIYSEQYSQAVNDAIDLLATLNGLIDAKIDFEKLKEDNNLKSYSGIAKKDVANLIKRDLALKKADENVNNIIGAKLEQKDIQLVVEHYSLKNLTNFVQKVKPYALFMSNIVEAKDESEIKSALENVILPVGSSTIKKNSKFNVSIQSYLGAYSKLAPLKHEYDNSWNSQVGVIAPIGFAFNWGLCKNWGSVSLFGSLLDLSAIVDYKLKYETVATPEGNDTTALYKDYKVELGQIFSPGVYFVYGFLHNLPISLGIGGQYGPGLSRIEGDDNTVVNDPQWRWNAFLAVDIPLFNLVNKPKDKMQQ